MRNAGYSDAKWKGRWIGGIPMLGCDINERGGALVGNEDEAVRVRVILNPEFRQRAQDRLHFNGRTGGRQMQNTYGAVRKGLLRCASYAINWPNGWARRWKWPKSAGSCIRLTGCGPG